MQSFIVFNEMLSLILMLALGFVCARRKYISKSSAIDISKLIVNVLNPALIISGAFHARPTDSMQVLGKVAIISLLMFLCLIAISYLYNIIMGNKKPHSGLYNLMMVFSNLGFIGMPIVQSLYGPSAIIYVSVFILIYNLLIYTYGIVIIQATGERLITLSRKEKISRILNPGVLSCIIAVLLVTFSIKPSVFCVNFFSYLANGAILLSLMMVGISLERFNLIDILNDTRVFTFSILKMLLIPLCTAMCVHFAGWTGVIPGVLVLMISMPVGNMPTMLAMEYGADDSLCAKGVAITTILSLVTLPVIVSFLA